MPSKRIFVLNGHPGETSLCRALSERYVAAARAAGHDVQVTHLNALEFDMDYGLGGYDNRKPLEACLETEVLQRMEWCNHIVITAPMWWGGLPAKLKGLFDRALVPGRAFDTRNTNLFGMPKGLLTGRSARVIMTSDTPRWFLRFAYDSAILHQIRGQILGFCGFRRARVTWLAGASHPDSTKVGKWMAHVDDLGRSGA
ncbi:MAG: NAD(P)H-dependent oxidoreductase [Pseudomonadota bacterium]